MFNLTKRVIMIRNSFFVSSLLKDERTVQLTDEVGLKDNVNYYSNKIGDAAENFEHNKLESEALLSLSIAKVFSKKVKGDSVGPISPIEKSDLNTKIGADEIQSEKFPLVFVPLKPIPKHPVKTSENLSSIHPELELRINRPVNFSSALSNFENLESQEKQKKSQSIREGNANNFFLYTFSSQDKSAPILGFNSPPVDYTKIISVKPSESGEKFSLDNKKYSETSSESSGVGRKRASHVMEAPRIKNRLTIECENLFKESYSSLMKRLASAPNDEKIKLEIYQDVMAKMNKIAFPPKAELYVSCPDPRCSYDSKRRRDLVNHIFAIHSNVPCFPCEQCGAFFQSIRKVDYHIAKKHI
jgi:hypothetical protein